MNACIKQNYHSVWIKHQKKEKSHCFLCLLRCSCSQTNQWHN